ncbi:MAG: type II toxin-antitoxin system prevent-host-death family antitoxin [Candidatus Sumerlaeota bacterium]
MIKVATKEFKNQFSHYLRKVEEGEEIVITRNGTPVALLNAENEDSKRERARRAFEGLRKIGDGIRARGDGMTWEEIKELRDRGRR